jgi:hypothetical protein
MDVLEAGSPHLVVEVSPGVSDECHLELARH